MQETGRDGRTEERRSEMKDNRTNENKGKNRTNPVQSLYREDGTDSHTTVCTNGCLMYAAEGQT